MCLELMQWENRLSTLPILVLFGGISPREVLLLLNHSEQRPLKSPKNQYFNAELTITSLNYYDSPHWGIYSILLLINNMEVYLFKMGQ
jgi:hypothetical protein